MGQTFEELEAQYNAARNRVVKAHAELGQIMGEPKPLLPGEEPPVITKEERDAQAEQMRALQEFAPIRDLYWATRWGREGNPPKS